MSKQQHFWPVDKNFYNMSTSYGVLHVMLASYQVSQNATCTTKVSTVTLLTTPSIQMTPILLLMSFIQNSPLLMTLTPWQSCWIVWNKIEDPFIEGPQVNGNVLDNHHDGIGMKQMEKWEQMDDIN